MSWKHRRARPAADGFRRPRPRRWEGWLAATLVLLGACSPDGSLRGANLILITIDTLRADHLGAYGYPRPTSPFLDSLAAEGVLFERAYSHSAYTRESIAALFTGRLPSLAGPTGWNAEPAPDIPTLAMHLRGAGYQTAFFSNTAVLKLPGFEAGFDEVQHLADRWNLSGAGPTLSQRAVAYLRERGERPFALYLHYLDPHAPYEPAPEFLARMGAASGGERLKLYSALVPRFRDFRQRGFGPGDPRFGDLVDRYDAEIAATDAAIRQLFDGLRELGLLDRTLVVVTSDHGEEFLEHGYVEHAWAHYDESLHVPLILWAPGRLAPTRVAQPVSQIDLLPTLLELLALGADQSGVGGRALLRRGLEGFEPAEARELHYAETLIRKRNVVRSITRGRWKYLAWQRWVPPLERERARRLEQDPDVDLWGPPVREELYDLAEDPSESRDRSSEAPAVIRELAALLAEQKRTSQAFARSLKSAADLSDEDRAALRALGYIE